MHKIGNFPAKIPPAEPLCSTEGGIFLIYLPMLSRKRSRPAPEGDG